MYRWGLSLYPSHARRILLLLRRGRGSKCNHGNVTYACQSHSQWQAYVKRFWQIVGSIYTSLPQASWLGTGYIYTYKFFSHFFITTFSIHFRLAAIDQDLQNLLLTGCVGISNGRVLNHHSYYVKVECIAVVQQKSELIGYWVY